MINLYDYQQPPSGDETFTELFKNEKVVISSIASNTLEEGGWYEQEEDEWLVLLEGEALLSVDDETLSLKRGDTLFIPAFQLHRVIKTSSDALWLTVHVNPN